MPSDEEYQQAIQEMQSELAEEKEKARGVASASASVMSGNSQQNLIEWQLDIKKELEEIEHLLRGDRIETDEEGNEIWRPPKDKSEALFNDKGVQEVLKTIRMYLNKNILLSNYDEKQIRERVTQFGHRLRRFIFLNYEDFGLDTEYKQKHYEMIVMNIVDMVDAAYWRAFRGGERDSLRTARTVTQQAPMENAMQGMGMGMQTQQPQQKRGLRRFIPGL